MPQLLTPCTVIALLTCPLANADGPATQQLGQASYYTALPQGNTGPCDTSGSPVWPRVSSDFSGPPPTNTWWSSLIWERYPGNDFGQPMHPHPMTMRATDRGIELGYVTTPNTWDRGYEYPHQPALTLGMDGLHAGNVQIANSGDWTVQASWNDEDHSFQATLGRGLPVVLAECAGSDPVVWTSNASVLQQSGATTILDIDGRFWGLFAPNGHQWTQETDGWRCAGAPQVAVGILPDTNASTIAMYEASALVAIRDSRVSWTWQADTRTVRATYTFDIEHLNGGQSDPLCCVYPHHTLSDLSILTGHTFQSARGELRLAQAKTFQVDYAVPPMLAMLPQVEGIDTNTALNYLNTSLSQPPASFTSDTYWGGKSFGRLAQLTLVADAIGQIAQRDLLLEELRTGLESWFVAAPSNNGQTASDLLQAEDAAELQGVSIAAVDGADGSAVTGFSDGDWLRLADIAFPEALPNRVVLRRASGATGSTMMRIRLNSPSGLVIAEAAVGSTGGWNVWNDLALGMTVSDATMLTGVHDVYITCEGGGGAEMFTVDRLTFEIPGSTTNDAYFAYHEPWGTLIGYPSSYGADGELNDHHFHYSYFLWAAAVVARFDPEWAAQDAFGGMVNLLIKDAANWDRTDQRFCFLRHFEPYVGHSYASGHAGFAAGNNQESSSEAVNFAAGCVLWGETTGQTAIRDLGLFLLAAEAKAVEQYWFDADEVHFPLGMPRELAGIIWDAGASYSTWWTANPEEIHGINMLPITGGSLHLGLRPDTIEKLWDVLIEENEGPPTVWQDILWSYLGLADADTALNNFLTSNSLPEAGDSPARTYWWLAALTTLGQVDPLIRGDLPLSAVFNHDGVRTYVAHHMGDTDRTVRFTDGFAMCVPAGQMVAKLRDADQPCIAGDLNDDGLINVTDLLLLLRAWGPCQNQACPTDLNQDGITNVADLQALLAAW